MHPYYKCRCCLVCLWGASVVKYIFNYVLPFKDINIYWHFFPLPSLCSIAGCILILITSCGLSTFFHRLDFFLGKSAFDFLSERTNEYFFPLKGSCTYLYKELSIIFIRLFGLNVECADIFTKEVVSFYGAGWIFFFEMSYNLACKLYRELYVEWPMVKLVGVSFPGMIYKWDIFLLFKNTGRIIILGSLWKQVFAYCASKYFVHCLRTWWVILICGQLDRTCF